MHNGIPDILMSSSSYELLQLDVFLSSFSESFVTCSCIMNTWEHFTTTSSQNALPSIFYRVNYAQIKEIVWRHKADTNHPQTFKSVSETIGTNHILGKASGEEHLQTGTGSSMHLLEGSMGLALSALICMAGVGLAKFLRIRGGGIPCITALVVLLATIFPVQIGKLAPSAECLAAILLQIFFATIGASGDVGAVITTAPSLFLFSFVQIAVHLILILGIGKFFNFELRQLLLASNANVGGPTTVAGMANAKGWKSLVVPGILTGIFGVAIATFLSIVLGLTVLRYL